MSKTKEWLEEVMKKAEEVEAVAYEANREEGTDQGDYEIETDY